MYSLSSGASDAALHRGDHGALRLRLDDVEWLGLRVERVEADSFYDLHATGQAPLATEAHLCKVGS